MDTTAKVDIRKLQLLNDRIAQTIDALNQVRLSVHGLGLSQQGNVPGVGFGGVPFQGVPFQGQGIPFQGQGIPFQGQGIPGVGQQMFSGYPGMVPGISHTTPFGYPQGQSFGQQGVNPLAQVHPLLSQLLWQQGMGGGLSHTSDPWGGSGVQGMGGGYNQGVGYPQGQGMGHQHGVGVDPMMVSRIMQMFPFAQMPISPIG